MVTTKKGSSQPVNFFNWIADKSKTQVGEFFFLLLIFVASLLVRSIGLRFGYPLLTHPDEPAIMTPVYNMTVNKNLNPNDFQRPDQILDILNLIYLNIISLVKTGKDLSVTFPANQFEYYFYARILIAILGSFIPIIAFKIGKENPINYSVPAAFIFAFFPLYVHYSRSITPDVPVTLFTLLIILFAIRYIRYRENKFLYLATFFAAVNTAEKYPGLISFGIVAFAILWVQVENHKAQPRLIIKNAVIEVLKFFAIYLLTFYIVAPNIVINYGKVYASFIRESVNQALGYSGLGWFGNLWFYITNFADFSNIVGYVFFFIGVFGIIKSRNSSFLPCLYGFVYWLLLSVIDTHWERWGLPMYTAPLLLIAFGMAYIVELSKKFRWIKPVGTIAFITLIAWSMIFSLSISIRKTYTNTIVYALQYCESSGITKENSISDRYTPFDPNGNAYTFKYLEIDPSKKYILLSSAMYERFYTDPQKYARMIQTYETIKNNDILIKEITNYDSPASNRFMKWIDDINYYFKKITGAKLPDRYTGNTIQIYQVK